jgi:hypothetical protein
MFDHWFPNGCIRQILNKTLRNEIQNSTSHLGNERQQIKKISSRKGYSTKGKLFVDFCLSTIFVPSAAFAEIPGFSRENDKKQNGWIDTLLPQSNVGIIRMRTMRCQMSKWNRIGVVRCDREIYSSSLPHSLLDLLSEPSLPFPPTLTLRPLSTSKFK